MLLEDSKNTTKPISRSEEVKSYGLLDFRTDQRFNDLLFIASQICEVPVAAINIIDEGRQLYKFKMGIAEDERALGNSLCESVFQNRSSLIVPDLSQDPQNGPKSLPTYSEPLLFYGGFPLVTSTGFVLGTFFIMDVRNRNLSAKQIEMLQKIAQQVVFYAESFYELKFFKLKTREAIHEINNHAAIISGSSYFLKDLAQKNPEGIPQIVNNAERIQSAIQKIVQVVKKLRSIVIS